MKKIVIKFKKGKITAFGEGFRGNDCVKSFQDIENSIQGNKVMEEISEEGYLSEEDTPMIHENQIYR